MAVFQCRCCGAALEVAAANTYCECAHCGVTQTVPILDFDEKAILWERADNLRRGGEYDRALSVYDRLAELCPDDPDIYWSKTLCRYGVEYIEENGSHKRIPTLNRIQYESVIDDENYRKAVSLADTGRRRVYVLWAKQLEELRVTTLAVTLAEKPYDIFICYKETDADGRRTEDSVIAAQLYKDLAAEGWRVFFSRVTLEDKAGTAFEPYIFAALNSAKIMLAVGTRPEHFNAVWTRNEWSRFLTLCGGDPEKTLAVLYKGMLPAQLPEEFAHLRRFDLAAPGVYDELMRGVRKALETSAERQAPADSQEKPAESADASALIRRARLFLEDGDFDRADELCEQALDLEPENADGYLVKLLAECGLSSEEELGGYCGYLTDSGNYAKALRFGDEDLVERLKGYAERSAYATYCLELENAVNETQLEAIAKRFEKLGYAEKAAEARRKAEQIIEKIRAEQAELDKRRERENELRLAERERKRKRKSLIIRAALIAVPTCAAVIVALSGAGAARLKSRYNSASELLSRGKYAEAAAAFDAMGDYSDAAELAVESRYRRALSLLDDGRYDEAKALFGETAGYSDSSEQILRADYLKAVSLGESGSFKNSAELFNSLGDYLDSGERASLMLYNYAASIENDNPGEAAEMYASLGNYMDSAEKYLGCSYSYAEKLLDENDFNGAADIFTALGNYSDSAAKLTECDYRRAVYDLENGSLDNAEEIFAALGDYKNSPEKLLETRYKIAERLAAEGNYRKAIALFEELGDYENAAEKLPPLRYQLAEQLLADEFYDDARAVFAELGSYSDASQRIAEVDRLKRLNVKPGDHLTLGRWQQGYNGETAPLEWVVLERDGSRALVMSEYLVDFMPFGGMNWAESEVRRWLNNDFYNKAFTSAERGRIRETELTNEDEKYQGTYGGGDTVDRIFLLTAEEAYNYKSSSGDLRADYTEWGEKKRKDAIMPTLAAGYSYASVFGDPYWLRSVGKQFCIKSVESSGGISNSTRYDTEIMGVRPVMWVEISE